GLIRGQVTKLLRGRLDRAVAERERLLRLGIDPLLVPSGGRGEDEPRSEGSAMAEYLQEEAGIPAERIHAETASRTTEENLTLSHRILDEAGHHGPYVVSTSRYHAFRAALLARGLGYDDEAIGGPTAFYYVPSATLREFIAVMSYRKVWNAVLLLPSLGLVALLVRAAMLSSCRRDGSRLPGPGPRHPAGRVPAGPHMQDPPAAPVRRSQGIRDMQGLAVSRARRGRAPRARRRGSAPRRARP